MIDPAVNCHCSEFEVNNWVISDFIVSKVIPVVGVRPYPIAELDLMVAAVCRLKPTVVFEWGTGIGTSTRIWYETAVEFGLNLQIHSTDLPADVQHVENPGASRGRMVRGLTDKRIYLHQGDGLETTIDIASQHSDHSRTLVYIDGDHSYESICRELQGIIRHLPGANILLHDTFYQSEASGYNIGPYCAIRDIFGSVSDRYRMIRTGLGLPGMTLLFRM